MNRANSIIIPLLAGFLLLPAIVSAQTSTTDWSIAALDNILTNAAPGQKTVRIDDMEILVSNVRAWRDRLAGVPQPKSAFDGSAPTWPDGNVYYTFDDSVTPDKQKAVLDGAAEWTTFANLHFIPRTNEVNYITFRQNDSLAGGQSAVGMIGGQQFTQFGPFAWNRPTTCHEIGHALGLIHEHQRSDRDSYVTILTNNFAPTDLGNFAILSDSRNQGPYDFLSVMHYARNALSIDPDNLDTIEPLPQYSSYLNLIGAKYDPVLSASDRAGMAAIYGVGPPQTNVVSNTLDAGPGSLRAALYYAFDNPGKTITFNIPTNDAGFSNGVFTILLSDVLPSLVNDTVLDGSSQPDNDPTNRNIYLTSFMPPIPGTFPWGLRFHGTNSAVKGLFLTGIPSVAVWMEQGASSNILGGPLASDRNVISGNGQEAIGIFDTNTVANIIQGNIIGLNAAGNTTLSNNWEGIGIYNGSRGNLVISNVISGNGTAGIRVGGAHNNVVQGNIIGLDASGTVALPNTWHGIGIFDGSQSNLIGGSLPSQRNVISGNMLQGITITDTNTVGNIVQGNYLGLNAAGAASISNTFEGISIYNGAQSTAIISNIISGNGASGVAISGPGTDNHIVQGNYIGLDALGANAQPNFGPGVIIYFGSQSNLVGGTTAATRNVISGNMTQGIALADANTIGNIVSGNYIGVNPPGTTAVSNTYAGIAIFNGASFNVIGGQKPGAGNVISGNGAQGLTMDGTGTVGNNVWGNFIGLNAAGDAAISNTWSGIAIFNGAHSNSIGGAAVSQRNIISGNGLQGVTISDPDTSGNAISGNCFGLNAAGTAPVPNHWAAVNLFGSPHDNMIGGSETGAGNVICGNSLQGIVIQSGASNNTVFGNFIGINPVGSVAMPNGDAGIGFWDGAVGNQVGGVFAGNANVIANNGSDAVQMFDATTTNNSIRGNSIFDNLGAGIVLYTGANLSSPAPSLASAVCTTETVISGSLTNLPDTTYQLDFYSSPQPAQGFVYLGSKFVLTDSGGSVTFIASLPSHIPAGRIITAAATDPTGNTSGMSVGVPVASTSTVNDTIPDAWRALYFGGDGTTTNSLSCATCDADQDGMNNSQEFLAGTDPTNASSKLRLTALTPNTFNAVASFNSTPGTVYQIQTRDSLSAGFWSIALDQIDGTGAGFFIVDPNLSPTNRFYRLQVLW